SSYAQFAQTTPAVLTTGSTYQITSSWTNNVAAANVVGNVATASYATKEANGTACWSYLSYNGSTLVNNNVGVQSITRLSVGSYGIIFSAPMSTNLFSFNFSGYSGSSNSTASCGYASAMKTTDFTMSVWTLG